MSAALFDPEAERARFINALWPDTSACKGDLAVWTKKPRPQTRWATASDTASVIASIPPNLDVYVTVQRHDRALSAKQWMKENAGKGVPKDNQHRGCAASAVAIPGLWLDIDCKDGAHKKKNLPSKAEAAELLRSLPLPPTMIVDSGGGYHAYALFKEPWVLEGESDREKARSLLQRFEALAKRSAAEKGWHMDSVADLARILRLPGTFNCKGTPEPVRILELNENLRVNPSEVCDILDLHAPEPKPVDRASVELTPNPGRTLSMAPRADAELLYAGCPWLANMKENASSQSEPEWYAALTLLSRCDDGNAECHELSRGYEGYSFEETEQKIRHAQSSHEPRSCKGIEQISSTKNFCEQCTHREKIKTPLQLGLPDPIERAFAMVQAAVTAATSEAMLDPTTLDAIKTLQSSAPSQYAQIEPEIHDALKSARIGRRSFNQSVRRQGKVIRLEGASTESLKRPEYEVRDDGLYWIKATQEGTEAVRLTNFTASITEKVVTVGQLDDPTQLHIEGFLEEESWSVKVSAEEFIQMKWPVLLVGPGAVIFPGKLSKERALTAIQLTSRNTVLSKVFSATGWWQVNDEYVYLHSKGAIGASGPIDHVSIELPRELSRIHLPTPAEGEELRRCYEAMKQLMDLAPRSVMCPLIALAFRAAMGVTDFAVHLFGKTGAGKSELAALIQQHFGADFTRVHLPASWSSTDNAIEALLFVGKDAVVVVDDLLAEGSTADAVASHKKAARVFRSQGNQSGRQRLSHTSQLKATYYPRGSLLSTGEENLRGHSIRARVLTIEVHKDTVMFERLSWLQEQAQAGRFSSMMASFISYLAPHYQGIKAGLPERVAAVRHDLHETDHKRTAGLVADLIVGADALLEFLNSKGIIDTATMNSLSDVFRSAILEAAMLHEGRNADANPGRRFIALLRSLLRAGRAHMEVVGDVSANVKRALGWRESVGEGLRPCGYTIGRYKQGLVFLNPEAAFAAVQSLAKEGGEPLLESASTVWSRMHEEGLIVKTSGTPEENRHHYRSQDKGVREWVICIDFTTLHEEPHADEG